MLLVDKEPNPCRFTFTPPKKSPTDIRDLLLGAGQEEIIEKTTGDYYWGCGTNGTGKNMLGIILMETRAQLQSDL